ncbi:MAG: 50S ribosomal protein L17 [Ignavibacteriae bacterium]|nr:50S ribosomal protein L17 [Ignavibacteriota bacterium]MCB9242787.1 50S ribosomal protein L17 [Ignavibacteriales bacterium]
MEHRTKGRKFSRTASHKKAMMSNLSVSLILHDRIKTTLAKAKELRLYVEPLVTKAKKANGSSEKGVHLRRVAKQFLKDDSAVKRLFDEIGPRYADRPGGYTRVLKTGHRYGDGADTAIIEFVDYDHAKKKEATDDDKSAKKKGKKGETAVEPKAKKTKSKKEDTKETKTKSEEKKPKKKASKKKEDE